MKHLPRVAPIAVLIVALCGGCDKNPLAKKAPDKEPTVTKEAEPPLPLSVKPTPGVRTPIDAGKP